MYKRKCEFSISRLPRSTANVDLNRIHSVLVLIYFCKDVYFVAFQNTLYTSSDETGNNCQPSCV